MNLSTNKIPVSIRLFCGSMKETCFEKAEDETTHDFAERVGAVLATFLGEPSISPPRRTISDVRRRQLMDAQPQLRIQKQDCGCAWLEAERIVVCEKHDATDEGGSVTISKREYDRLKTTVEQLTQVQDDRRRLIATAAMQGFISNSRIQAPSATIATDDTRTLISTAAVQMADAIIAALDKKPGE